MGIPNNWLNELIIYETSRNGIYCKINLNRIKLCDKYIFDFSVKVFNSLPKNIRNECNFNRFIVLLNQFL